MRLKFFLLILPLVLFSSCSSPKLDTLEKIQKSQKFQIGTDATYPPFESKDTKTGQIVGFDIGLMREICRKIGAEPDFIVVPFDGIIPGLNNNKYDAIISAFTITAEREEVVDFSQPYYDAGQTVAVPVNNTTIHGFDDLRGKTVGTQLGTTGEILAKQIPDAKVISFDNISSAFIDMENGKLDAIVNDKPTSEMIIAVRGSAKLVGPVLTQESYGIAVRQGDANLLKAINTALSELVQEGVLDSLRRVWIASHN
ncbi:MAG: basic amino acid ABC transporter substrate-binding protein [candidate division Zixibacteria bacterium]|nr:basic amino acid ABC transporter substrate-binding protein [candidate division Zixibacteria bacterium]